jgi:UDP-N-acetyl-2-amino-2-deoxyglucuronate dehydrogenase
MNDQRKFAIIGVGGYIAARHLIAIKDTGNVLLASLDPSDSVGIIDSFFPNSHFFVEFERFDRHIDKLRRSGIQTEYVSICSPNYLHDSHIRFALRSGAHAICEKPLVLNPWNIDPLREIESESGKRIFNILQLRLHPALIRLKKKIDDNPEGSMHDIDLTYITSRGNWYFTSWKGDLHTGISPPGKETCTNRVASRQTSASIFSTCCTGYSADRSGPPSI